MGETREAAEAMKQAKQVKQMKRRAGGPVRGVPLASVVPGRTRPNRLLFGGQIG
jgi:hypothetical protein